MSVLASSLLAFGVCGCVGVLVDIDHVIAHKFGKDYRFLHVYYLLVACIILCGCFTYLGRLLVK